MMKRLAKWIGPVLLVVFLGSSLCCAGLPEIKSGNSGKPLRVLFIVPGIGWRPKAEIDAVYQEQLKQKGYDVTVVLGTHALTGEYLKQFNTVVVAGVDSQRLIGYRAPALLGQLAGANNEKVLKEYVENGGGVLWHVLTADAGAQCAAGMRKILKPYGISTLAEQVRDPGNDNTNLQEGKPGAADHSYSWTENVQSHPTTKGVKRIYYPTNITRWDDAYCTNPLILKDPAWKPLVVGGPKSATFCKTATYVESWWKPGSISTPPVIAAARDYGKGRIAVSGISPYFTVVFASSLEVNNGMECHTGKINMITLEKGATGINEISAEKIPEGPELVKSDGAVLFDNLHRWLAEPGLAAGMGQGQVALPPPPSVDPAAVPGVDLQNRVIDWDKCELPRTWATGVAATKWGFYPEVDDPLIGPEMKYYKMLIGARTKYSTGKNTVAEMAAAAKEAGYSAIAFTEYFPDLTRQEWEQLKADCEAASTDDFICVAGIDIEDEQGLRWVIFGQDRYPFDWWLDRYRRLLRNQATLLQFGNQVAAMHRTGQSPYDWRLAKHFTGVALENWGTEPRDFNKNYVPDETWKQLDNGWACYQWQAANESNPIPIVVKEVKSVEEVAKAASHGLDQILPSDTVKNAVDYFCANLGAWWDDPGRFFVSSGPTITRWAIRNKDEGDGETLKRFRVAIGATSDEPITQVLLMDNFNTYRRWTPNAKEFSIDLDGRHGGRQHHFVLVVTDAKGRRAISPTIRTVSMPGYYMRCGDRQNFFNTPISYTGYKVPLFSIRMPVANLVEGSNLKPGVYGADGCPVGEYAFASNALNVTEATIDTKYAWATEREVSYDARPLYATSRTNVIDGKLRYYHLQGTPWIICEATLRPRHPYVPGSRVWPAITGGAGGGVMTVDGQDKEFAVQGITPLPKGTWLPSNIITISEGLVTDGGAVGFDAGTSGQPISTNAQWTGRFLIKKGGNTVFFVQAPIGKDEGIAARKAMGFVGSTPYNINLTQGALTKVEVLAYLRAANGGAAGSISAANIGYPLPLHVSGINPNIDFGRWQPGQPIRHFGVYEGAGWANIDISKGATFYVGNLVTCDRPELKISVPLWTRNRIFVQVNNPTGQEITATIRTATAVNDHLQFTKQVTVPAGTSIDVTNE